MAYLNKAMLIGNVGKNPEVRSVQGGAKVAQFTLATTEKYTDRDGGSHENTEWHNIVVWNKPAEFVEKFVQKGTLLFVEGKIRTRSFDKDGEKRYVTEIVADKIQTLGKRESQGDAEPVATAPSRPQQFEDDNDDIPF